MGQTKNLWIGLVVVAVAVVALAWYYSGTNPVTDTADETPGTPTSQAGATTGGTQSTKSTGAAVSNTSNNTTKPPAPTSSGITVTYTSKGFSPNYISLKAGKALTFINKSSGAMRVVTTKVPTLPGQPNPGFEQSTAVGLNGTFVYNFTIPGEWYYKDALKPEFFGVVVVTPQ